MVLVVFGTKMRDDADLDEYARHSRLMNELVKQIPGFISIKGFVGEDGEQISIARFESDDAVKAWRSHPEHLLTQRRARESFYASYWVQVCQTVRDYEWAFGTGRINRQNESASDLSSLKKA
jgi:heme-degrading monooxygenase HmoA